MLTRLGSSSQDNVQQGYVPEGPSILRQMSDATLSEGPPDSFSDSSSESSARSKPDDQVPSRKGAIARRQRSPGQKCFPLRIGRRKIIFLERDKKITSELPVVRLDPFLERHVLPCRTRSGTCPQCSRFQGKSVSLAALKIGAIRGCPLCILAYFAIAVFFTDKNPAKKLPSGYGKFKSFVNLGLNTLVDAYTFSDTRANQWNFYGTTIPAGSIRNFFTEDLSSEQTAQFALRQLQDCITQHSRCGNHAEQKRPPTRLLDVSTLRLRDTDHPDFAASFPMYACLSHCWGSGSQASNILRTTKATLAAYGDGIPTGLFPRTFREAIQFTRSINLPYIWIDSLCIVQDDKLDWEKEAAAMADIYMNCHVTLAATVSENSDGGLFVKKSFGSVRIGVVSCQRGNTQPLYMRLPPDHWPLDTDFPLAQRGWVMQETILSPRTLYFLGTELLYECRETIQCECNDEESCDWTTVKQYEWTTADDWTRVLLLYSHTLLSFSRDTLPALSGLAKRWLATHPADVYLAGIWRSDLIKMLCWQITSRSARRARPWRASSWSWASIDTANIEFQRHLKFSANYSIADVVDVYCAQSGADPTGTVAFGHLILRGRGFDAQLHYGGKDDGTGWDDYEDAQVYAYKDGIRFECNLDFAAWEAGRDHIIEGSTVRMLFIAGPEDITRFVGARWTLILLRPLFGDTYERVGITIDGFSTRHQRYDTIPGTRKLYEESDVAEYFIV
ncbi:hypothetical protein HBI79_034610 [Parastagonospora nodorum]|nr:hypothetical protein HBI79_034610 [Parastagonospora nodorum]